MLKPQKQPIGHKFYLKLQVCELVPMPPEKIINFSEKTRQFMFKYERHSRHAIVVPVWQINTPENLVKTIRDNYGFGLFNVLFWCMWVRNKRLKPKFRCYGESCYYFQNNRCDNTRFFNHRTIARGWCCKQNKKYTPNWYTRAKIEIMPNYEENLFSERDYSVRMIQCDMHKFKWFWFVPEVELKQRCRMQSNIINDMVSGIH